MYNPFLILVCDNSHQEQATERCEGQCQCLDCHDGHCQSRRVSASALTWKSEDADKYLSINHRFSGLYRGITSKLLQSVLTAALLFASKERIYDFTKKALAPVAAATNPKAVY